MKKIISILLAALMLLSSASMLSTAEDAPAELTPKKSSGITIDSGFAVGIPGNPTAGELCAMFDGAVTVSNGDKVLGESDIVPSGAVISNGTSDAKTIIYGDINSDGKINVPDVIRLLQKIAKFPVSVAEKSGDVNCDGKENVTDAIAILKYTAKWRIWLGGVGMSVTDKPQTAEDEDATLALSFGNGIDVYTGDTLLGDEVTDVMYAAKGEIEFTQFTLESDGGHNDLSVEITDFTNAKGNSVRTELYNVAYISISDPTASASSIADIMVPNPTGINIAAGKNAVFGVKAYPDSDVAYGLYEATVTVKNTDGKEIKKALVFLNVWDFVLPEASYCRTSVGLSKDSIGATKTATVEERYKNYYDMFIENRLNPTLLPYDICSEEAVEYLNDPRVNSFIAGGKGYGNSFDATDEQLRERYAYLSQNEEWLEKAYFYYDDEPLNFVPPNTTLPTPEERVANIKNHYEHVRELFPGAKLIIPNHYNAIDERFEGDIVGYVMKYSSILCPHSWMFNDYNKTSVDVYYTEEMTNTYGTLQDRIAEKLASDPEAEFWWYTSDNPRDGMCNIYPTKPGIECRTLFWQQYLYGADGFLYWAVSNFDAVSNRNNLIYTTDKYPSIPFVGLLCYNNLVYKTDEAIGSVRLEFVRDGIEDFDYLHMIEEQFGKEVADSFVTRITTDLLYYNSDSSIMEEVRMEMGELLQGWE